MQDRQKSVNKGAREGPRRDFRRFWVDFRVNFHVFSRQHRASEVTRRANGRTLGFADRRGTLEGLQTLQKNRNSTKIVEKQIRKQGASEACNKNALFPLAEAPRSQFWSARGAPRRSRAVFLALRVALEHSPGTPGTLPG